jgi:tetratricopeptide (TPR) repeat protein
MVSTAAHNLSIVLQKEGEAALAQGNSTRARECFLEASKFIGESLAIVVESQSEPDVAKAHGQCAQVQLLLGDVDKAEEYARRALVVHARFDMAEALVDYGTLAAIAYARNQPIEAAACEQKRDALRAELRRRAGAPALPERTIQAITQLAFACAQAGHTRAPLDAGAEEALATLATYPAPFDALVPFLRALAAGNLPALPPSLPRELAVPLEQVLAAVRQARAGG